ncbi:MAG: hypothetical protein U5L73_05115 [Rhodoferax sp.]|uniref:hypothetical protein n=1 Tax=Rhodoferax sp. TaxID=50421 RepID=UPI002ACDBB76|nr:hypothetical protein [Rhodoferax sp.]MDZ7891122.1 hypothetical protein [Rhodoferax sp.]
MNRCLRAIGAISLLVALPFGGMAQTNPTTQVVTDSNGNYVTVRTFPSTAVRGTLQVVQPPEVLFNNVVARLSPGARIRGANGMLLMSASAVGQTLQVMAVLDSQSMLHDVWVLNEIEVAMYPTKPSYSR